MKVLIDTNIFLDLFLKRELFFKNSSNLFSKVSSGELQGVVAAHSIPTLYYILKKATSQKKTMAILTDILNLFQVGELTHKVCISAQQLSFPDYEDALVCDIAHREGCTFIVTRNTKDFKGSLILALTPEDLFKKLR